MKKDLLTILCMSLICASVMLGIMGLYRIVGAQSRRHRITPDAGIGLSVTVTETIL